ncbi:MAG: DUF5681 domain-containing protein [Steroidobacteraceae bacterium]
MNDGSEQPSRSTNGLRPFPPGVSGNPKGRPPRGFAKAERLRSALARDLPDILKKLVAAAKGGDVQAARTILERVLPPLKAMEAPAPIGALAGSLPEQGQAVITAVAAGFISPGQATALLGALASQAKLIETDDLAKRIAAIEQRLGANGHAKS